MGPFAMKDLSYKNAKKFEGEISFPEAVDLVATERCGVAWTENEARSLFPFFRRRNKKTKRRELKRRKMKLKNGQVFVGAVTVDAGECKKEKIEALLEAQRESVDTIIAAVHSGGLRGRISPTHSPRTFLDRDNANLLIAQYLNALCAGYIRLKEGDGFCAGLITFNVDDIKRLAKQPEQFESGTYASINTDRVKEFLKGHFPHWPDFDEGAKPLFTKEEAKKIIKHALAATGRKKKVSNRQLLSSAEEVFPQGTMAKGGRPSRKQAIASRNIMEKLGIEQGDS